MSSSDHGWVAPGCMDPQAPPGDDAYRSPGISHYQGYDPMVPGYRPMVRIATVHRTAVALIVVSSPTWCSSWPSPSRPSRWGTTTPRRPPRSSVSAIRGNVDQIDKSAQRFNRVWAWLGWLVPVVNLWFPHVVVSDAVRVSSDRWPPLRWWWAAWLVAGGLSLGTESLLQDGLVPTSAIRLYGPVNAVGAAVFAVAFALWVVIISSLTRAQRELLEQYPTTNTGVR